MRITFLSHFPGRGGSTTMLRQLREFFENRGHHCSVVVGEDNADAIIKDYVVVPGASNWRARMKTYKQTIEDTQPDIVYSISGRDEFDVLKFLGIPRVRHVFSLEQHEYANIPLWIQQLHPFVELLTANTPDVFEYIRATTEIKSSCLVAPYCFSERFFSPITKQNSHSRKDGEIEVCFIGRLESFQKRAHWLPEIVRRCREQGRSLRWHVYGEGPCREFIRKSLQKFGCENLVQFHGWVDESTLARKISTHDIFFLCSRWEGLPISMAQAMLCGLACLVPHCPAGMTYLLEQGGGWLYNATSTRNAVQALLGATFDLSTIMERKLEAKHLAGTLFANAVVEAQLTDLETQMSRLSFNGNFDQIENAKRMEAVPFSTLFKRKLSAPFRKLSPC